MARTTPLHTELEAQRQVNTASARFWRITKPNRLNEMGGPVSDRLHPGPGVGLLMHEDSPMRRRACPGSRSGPSCRWTKVGFHLLPDGFFDGNPALDLPRPDPACHEPGDL